MNLLLRSASQIVNPLDARRRFGFGSGVSGAEAFIGALDAYAASLTVVAGVKRWLGSYNGPCLRARKNVGGNPEQDFGFTSTGDFDLAALDSWAGSDSVFLKGFYDQKSGTLISQTTAASQLRLVNAGTVDTTPGGLLKPCATGANMGGYAVSLGSTYSGTTATVISGHILANSSTFGRVASLVNGAGNDFTATTAVAMILRNNAAESVAGYRNLAVLGAGDAITYGSVFAASARLTGTNHVITTDGTTVSAASSGALSVNTLIWGGSAAASPYMQTGDAALGIVVALSDLGATDAEAIRQLFATYHT